MIGIGSEVQKNWSRKNASIFEGPRSIYIGEIWFLDPNRGWILPYIKRPRAFKNWRHFSRPNFLNFRSNPNHFTNLFPGSSCISEWARTIFPDFQGSGAPAADILLGCRGPPGVTSTKTSIRRNFLSRVIHIPNHIFKVIVRHQGSCGDKLPGPKLISLPANIF